MAPVTLISSPPRSISPAEHRQLIASTPASFDDIPPVLRHKEEGAAVSFDPPLEGFSTEDGARGTLYVTESVLAFLSDTRKGFQIEYPTITLHAISRGESEPAIYCQLDEVSLCQDENATDAEEAQEMRELRLRPNDSASLEPIFEALSLCAALHPDPQESNDMDDMDDAFVDAAGERGSEIFTGDETQETTEVGRVRSDFLNDNRYAPY
ncbi:hypothetical protein K439DRAFT_1645316 [Ramaria rubella]|nr:hypothetical protein K439DRAFT_1645316 [Ramaria rubella]